MRYNDNREVNEMEHRQNGERDIVNSSDLQLFLGDDNYQDKAEEMLLDILNGQYDLLESRAEILRHKRECQ